MELETPEREGGRRRRGRGRRRRRRRRRRRNEVEFGLVGERVISNELCAP